MWQLSGFLKERTLNTTAGVNVDNLYIPVHDTAQCRGVLLIWLILGQGPAVLAVGADRGIWTFFFLASIVFYSPSPWDPDIN